MFDVYGNEKFLFSFFGQQLLLFAQLPGDVVGKLLKSISHLTRPKTRRNAINQTNSTTIFRQPGNLTI